MALLTNDQSGAGYLAVELTIDKQLQPVAPFARGPVVSWDMPDEVYEELAVHHVLDMVPRPQHPDNDPPQ
jgi:hypothetical protein